MMPGDKCMGATVANGAGRGLHKAPIYVYEGPWLRTAGQ